VWHPLDLATPDRAAFRVQPSTLLLPSSCGSATLAVVFHGTLGPMFQTAVVDRRIGVSP
jgi:hypothetical protein